MSRKYALGYSTCGFAAGRPMLELVHKLGELGYEGVELELDRDRFHPHYHSPTQLGAVGRACREVGLRMVLGTGGRHVLTARRHYPSAICAEPDARRAWVDFVRDSLNLAAEMQVECVMVHSGYTPEGLREETTWDLLVDSMGTLAEHAAKVGQRIAVEWHPEMFLRTGSQYIALARDVGNKAMGCTFDVGHAHCTEDGPLGEIIETFAAHTIHVQMEDMRDRVHKHLPLGEGELNFREIFGAFDRTEYAGVVALEFNAGDLGGNGDQLAERSIRFLRDVVGSG
ncbi:sugar phosphate isomerase/epimerase family protein [Pendulispora albinea]|uniref:Sugar phosphate isomerase/epimerase n=1 Tax=Pendulispora albinea TaxID=2741071 RepID=A0ABZ2MBR9_9BACT